jgi:hypothetical protein
VYIGAGCDFATLPRASVMKPLVQCPVKSTCISWDLSDIWHAAMTATDFALKVVLW